MNNQEDGKDEIVSNKMDGILRPHGNFDWGKIWSIEPWWFWGTQFWDNPRSLLVSSHRTGWMCQAVKSVHQVCSPCEVGICKVFEKKKKHVKRTQQIKGMWYHGGLQRQTASSRAVLGCKAKSTRLIGNCRQHLALAVLPGCWMQVVLILWMQLGKKDAHELIPSSHPIEEFLNCKG